MYIISKVPGKAADKLLMTNSTLKRLERVLQKARSNVFLEDQVISQKNTEIMYRVKSLLKPIWQARQDNYLIKKYENYHM